MQNTPDDSFPVRTGLDKFADLEADENYMEFLRKFGTIRDEDGTIWKIKLTENGYRWCKQ